MGYSGAADESAGFAFGSVSRLLGRLCLVGAQGICQRLAFWSGRRALARYLVEHLGADRPRGGAGRYGGLWLQLSSGRRGDPRPHLSMGEYAEGDGTSQWTIARGLSGRGGF